MNITKETFDRLAEGSNQIIASPATIEKLKEQGFQFDVVSSQTLEELFDERKKYAAKILSLLPDLPNDLSPALKSLYQQIRECILFGLHGAAITLSGNLIEFVVKHVTFVAELGGYQSYDAQKWDEFEEIELGMAIGRAKKAGLLDSKMAKRIQSFREDIRNPYSHYNIRKITANVVAGQVKVVNASTGEATVRDIEAKEDPVIQAAVKPHVDASQVLHVFHFADEVLKYLLRKLENKLHGKDAEATAEPHKSGGDHAK